MMALLRDYCRRVGDGIRGLSLDGQNPWPGLMPFSKAAQALFSWPRRRGGRAAPPGVARPFDDPLRAIRARQTSLLLPALARRSCPAEKGGRAAKSGSRKTHCRSAVEPVALPDRESGRSGARRQTGAGRISRARRPAPKYGCTGEADLDFRRFRRSPKPAPSIDDASCCKDTRAPSIAPRSARMGRAS